MSRRVAVAGAFDDLRLSDVRFLEEASRFGELRVSLWSDELARSLSGRAPAFSLEERRYLLESLRFVGRVEAVDRVSPRAPVPEADGELPDVWAVREAEATAEARRACDGAGVRLEPVPESRLAVLPADDAPPLAPPEPGARPRVVVTGCYDWLHSGHVRFFEEVSALGELYVALGNDANVRALKGEGHPLFPQEVRRYLVQAVRFVSRAFVSSGWGQLDAEAEIATIRPAIYAVNRDGDRPEKRDFCAARGILYVVLERTPRPGLPCRSSTELRGF